MKVETSAVLMIVLLLAGCSNEVAGTPAASGIAPTSTTSSKPVESSPAAEKLWVLPAQACEVISAELISALRLVKPQPRQSGMGNGCKWQVGEDEKLLRWAYVDYSSWRSVRGQKSSYDRMKQSDAKGGRGLGARVLGFGDVTHIGSKSAGIDFDEGYFFYGHEEVVRGLKNGVETTVLRKGNVTIELSYSGGKIESVVNGRINSSPDAIDVAQGVIDKLADSAVNAIVSA